MASTLNALSTGGGGLVSSGDTSGVLALQTNGTTTMTLDTSGNVGIGTTSPSKKLESAINAANETTSALRVTNLNTSGYGVGIEFADELSSGRVAARIASNTPSTAATGDLYFQTRTASALTEKMRINSSGNLLVGTTSAPSVTSTSLANYGLGFNNDYSGGNAIVINSTSTSSNQYYIGFGRGSAQAGYILSSTTNSTTYSTSSDYRLKNDITPMSNALSKVALLKPCTWKWKLDNTSSQGFIAHELAEVIPEAVAGTKDEVDSDGNPRYQGVDTSFVVATLTAAIQEAKVLIDTQAETINALTARVVALESKVGG